MAHSNVLGVLLLPVVVFLVVKCTPTANLGYLGGISNYADTAQNVSTRCLANTVTPASCANMKDPSDYLMAHPDDCRLFYYCLSPILPPVCRDCPFELHYNPTLRECDWPYRAGCKVNKA